MRLHGIDLLRGIAVTSVIVYHFFAILGLQGSPLFSYIHSLGLFGVSLFFIISGFLIYRSIHFNIEKNGIKKGLLNYSLHRLFRILPAYYINLFVILIMVSFIISADYLYSFSFIKQVLSHLTFLSYFIYKDAGFSINGAYWTLSIEMLWYFIAPLLYIYIKKDRYLVLIFFIAILYFVALDYSIFDSLFHISPKQSNYWLLMYYFSFQIPGQMLYFIAGILIYKYHIKIKLLPVLNSYAIALSLIIAFMLITGTYEVDKSFVVNNLLILTVVANLFILIYQQEVKYFGFIEWLGKISYSLYLWHMPLLYIMKKTFVFSYLSIFYSVVLFVISLLAISSLSYYLVEEGGFSLRKKITGI